jgi:hypothetical protein
MLELPTPAVVPLIVSAAHLLYDAPNSMDWAMQYFVLAMVFAIIESTAGHRFSWMLLSPLVFAGIAGPLLHTVGDNFLRNKRLY